MAMFSNNFSSGWSRHVQREATSFDKRLRASMDGTTSLLDPSDPEKLTAVQLRQAAELAAQEDANIQLAAEVTRTGTAFCKLHPEYIDSDANANLMRHTLRAAGKPRPTIEDFETAYAQLRESNFLKLNQKVLKDQEDQAAQRLAEGHKNRHVPTEDERYKMSLADLRRLEDSEMQKQMQRRGEEGGW